MTQWLSLTVINDRLHQTQTSVWRNKTFITGSQQIATDSGLETDSLFGYQIGSEITTESV